MQKCYRSDKEELRYQTMIVLLRYRMIDAAVTFMIDREGMGKPKDR